MNNLKITLLTLLICAFAQNIDAQSLWQTIETSRIPEKGTRYIVPDEFKTYTLNEEQLAPVLATAPLQNTRAASSEEVFFSMPMPDGRMKNFQIINSPVMAPGLAARYPEIQTYSGFDVDNPANTVRFDLTPAGFHAMIFTEEFGTVYIDPYFFGEKGYYIVYRKRDFRPASPKNFVCDVVGEPVDISKFEPDGRMAEVLLGDCTMRTYRFAVAATGEYTTFHGGTVAQALAAQVTTMNRVNGVYMRDMAVFMELVANNDVIIYTDANSDPYTNGNPGSMINEVQTDIDNNIGSGNYDVGHVFGTNSGGLAGLGVICSGSKARGVTGSGSPVGDPFDIDYVAHELGHQFGCNHTFNNSCGGNRSNSTAYEPGSGSTIMAYAGICPPNIQSNSDDHFHVISLQEMSAEILSTSCPTLTPLANTPPTINNVPTGLTIPGATPFELTADASDVDGNTLSYCWEQMDREISTQSPVSTSTDGPNFRSNPPVTSPTRYFPNLPDVLAGNSPTWEVLATVDRVFNFRVTVRDNADGGGCSVYEESTINVDGDSGPFLVQNPDATGITWNGNSNTTVSWDVAGTDNAPVSCANVDILLSTDGGLTYPVTLATNTPNDGNQSILVPNTATTTARVKVVCSDNVFYDVSNNNFTIVVSANPDYALEAVPATLSSCNSAGSTYSINVSSILGFSDPVNLSLASLPAGLSGTFSPNPVNPGSSSTLTLSGSIGTGSYNFDVVGNSTTGTKTLSVTLEVTAPAPVVLSTPPNQTTGVSLSEVFEWVASLGSGVTYDFQLDDNPDFSSPVVNQTGLTTNSYTATGLSSGTNYYWRVRASNNCGGGPYSQVFSFQTALCQVFSSTDIPLNIPADQVTTVSSTLTISGLDAITDINIVELSGTHTWINDMVVNLVSPTGTDVSLWSQVCGNENNFDVKFDDAAANSNLPCPPVDGQFYQPNGSLADFNGEDPNGTWTLNVGDVYPEDGGAVQAWAIEVCTSAPAVPCPVDLVLSNVQNAGTSLEEVLNSIISSATITGNAEVEYSAGALIHLTNGFSVEAGASMDAYILGCDIPSAKAEE